MVTFVSSFSDAKVIYDAALFLFVESFNSCSWETTNLLEKQGSRKTEGRVQSVVPCQHFIELPLIFYQRSVRKASVHLIRSHTTIVMLGFSRFKSSCQHSLVPTQDSVM